MRRAVACERVGDVDGWRKAMRAWVLSRPVPLGDLPEEIEVGFMFWKHLQTVAQRNWDSLGPEIDDREGWPHFLGIRVVYFVFEDLPFAEEFTETMPCQ